MAGEEIRQVVKVDGLEEALKTLVECSVDTGTADATSAVNHLDDSAKSWPVNAFTDLIIEITGGTGEGQMRKITSNTATSIVPTVSFATAPDATSTYRIGFFGKMTADITSWGGTALTGRDISLDLKALTDDSIKGLLKSIGDIAALENLVTRIGQTTDAIVAAGATGSMSAKLRRVTQGLEDLKTLVVLAAGTNLIGAVNPRSEAGAGQTPVGITVTAASTQILAANANRKVAIITNDSDTTIYLAIGVAAQANKGIRLNANGGTIVISRTGDIYSTEAVNGILAVAGNKVATAQELN